MQPARTVPLRLVAIAVSGGLCACTGATAPIYPLAADYACHPSYGGQCVPVAVGDVDCAGGGGDGPAYVTGPVNVIGPDEYELDPDGDGFACEPFRR